MEQDYKKKKKKIMTGGIDYFKITNLCYKRASLSLKNNYCFHNPFLSSTNNCSCLVTFQNSFQLKSVTYLTRNLVVAVSVRFFFTCCKDYKHKHAESLIAN